MPSSHLFRALFCGTLLTSSNIGYSAGFQLQERSVSGLGRAFAGEAAIAEDASAIATNAANMLLLEKWSISAGASYISPNIEVSGTFTPTGSPLSLDTSDDGPAPEAVVPYLYISHKVSEDWALGLALHSRFGLSTDYAESFLATSQANKSEITTIYISPKIAYRINSKWSLGAGFDAIQTEGTLTNSISSDLASPAAGADIVNVEGDGWSYGFNIGTLYELNEKTRIGLSYYSKVDLSLEGSLTTDLLPFPGGKTDAKVEQEVPQSIELSGYHELDDQWTLHSSFTWTDWSVFEELVIETNTQDFPKEENWKDTFRIALGATYQCNDKWTYRVGLAFDESPVQSKDFRTLRIPDSDRYWLSVGSSYQVNNNYSIDIGYTYVFANSVELHETDATGTFKGKLKGNVHILGLAFNGSF
ncbi:OmpP1/FadL family transporter [Rubritalea sp.]|uniref:OmpP1/FadL family transporter n=1 Tax=Rubritalea sp. TaxID=2109375 RepID=UPI003EF733E6